MMYWKALLMGDDEIADRILAASDPAEAKALGREVSNFDQEVWNDNCDGVVEKGNFLKFQQNQKLKDVLQGTGNRMLVQTSPNDKVWGIGFNTEDALRNESDWGENKLGKALMKVREQSAAHLLPRSVPVIAPNSLAG